MRLVPPRARWSRRPRHRARPCRLVGKRRGRPQRSQPHGYPCRSSPPTRLFAMLPAPIKAILSAIAACSARSEECRADSDHRRAFRNRGFEVLCHAHRQCVPMRCALGFARSNNSRIRRNAVRCTVGVGFRAWNRHESAQTDARQLQYMRRKFCQSVRCDTRLLWFVVDVDLYQYVESVGVVRALFRQTLCDLGAIERLHPLKVARDVARFVRLNRADEMPCNDRSRSASIFGNASFR